MCCKLVSLYHKTHLIFFSSTPTKQHHTQKNSPHVTPHIPHLSHTIRPNFEPKFDPHHLASMHRPFEKNEQIKW
jgi:hypothetical protein